MDIRPDIRAVPFMFFRKFKIRFGKVLCILKKRLTQNQGFDIQYN